jgi:hypothetical protein
VGVKLSSSWAPGALEARLKQIGERAVSHGADAMRKTADEMQELARDIAPIKTGDLEEAIEVGEERGDNRRIEVFVYLDKTQTVHRGFEYGSRMHKSLTPVGPLNLGPLSEAKNSSSPLPVGGAFIRRAAEALVGPLKRAVRKAIKNAL